MLDIEFGQVMTCFALARTMRSTCPVPVLDGELLVPGYVLWARNLRGVFSIQVTAETFEVVDALYGMLRTLQPTP